MAEGFITRKGGVAATKAPSLNFVSKTDSEIVFTITNNDDATVDVFWELSDNTPDANQIQLNAGQTSSNQTVSGLTANTQYTIFAFANKTNKAGSDTVSLTTTTDTLPYIEATGGTTTTYEENGTFYKEHTFTSSGTFTVTQLGGNSTINKLFYFVVGGGGGGGGNRGAGGGGGYTTTGNFTPSLTSYNAVVGGGGGQTNSGNQSQFLSFTANGGNGGLNYTNCGTDGGSGGGAGDTGNNNFVRNGGSNGGDSGPGNPAVTGCDPQGQGQGTTTRAFGISTRELYAGGGGGGGFTTGDSSGGAGGGGQGGIGSQGINAVSGTVNTGGGGGGGRNSGSGASGGSGIVKIRYEVEAL